jgi:hypothetical protein
MKRTMILSLGVLAVACGGAGSPMVPSPVPQSPGAGSGPTSTTAAAPLSAPVLQAMESTLQDEYHAEAIYRGVMEDLGAIWPFANIVRAETQHAASIAQLYEKRGLEPPSSRWGTHNVPRFDSLGAACSAAAQAELDNVALYDEPLALDLPNDVRNVFQHNRDASLYNHLPAFQSCTSE